MNDSASFQGVIDARVKRMNSYRQVMADVQLALNPLAVTATIILNHRTLDTYNEGILTHEASLIKKVLLTKAEGLHYVQDRVLANLLAEVADQAYVLRLTITDLPRIIAIDDQVNIAGILYTISKVSPYNRFNDSILVAVVYPTDNLPPRPDTGIADDGDSDPFDQDLLFMVGSLTDLATAKANGATEIEISQDLGTVLSPITLMLDWPVCVYGKGRKVIGSIILAAEDVLLTTTIVQPVGSDPATAAGVVLLKHKAIIVNNTFIPDPDNDSIGLLIAVTDETGLKLELEGNDLTGFSGGDKGAMAIVCEEGAVLDARYGMAFDGLTTQLAGLADSAEFNMVAENRYDGNMVNYLRRDEDGVKYVYISRPSFNDIEADVDQTLFNELTAGIYHIDENEI